ncbi:LytTR family DNA-binding domain-containing protein [Maricaulis sp.]|uniref:LytR/AlgR family response regulator transcription factor n=1 Tax=Maricaulis sp. TaxID=1486257 RepID=UPI0026045F62|nr:LytTR family DNA-binding domain-containing protein [Maricaulis sp.]
MKFVLFFFALLFLAPLAAEAQSGRSASVGLYPIDVCPDDGSGQPPADFSAPACEQLQFHDIDPQNTSLWIRARLDLSEALLQQPRPLGLFISGKAAAHFWVNGVDVGGNGVPADRAEAERPGRMDAVRFVEKVHLRAGENEVIARLSGHHSQLTLRHPMHYLGIRIYAHPTRWIMNAYWVSMITLGAFTLGFIFFGVSAIRGEDRLGSSLISLLSLTAAAQLLTEAGRGIFAYPYPMHDLRLIGIVAFSALFGLLLVAYLLHRFSGLNWKQQALRLAVVALPVSAAIWGATGFDGKAGFAFMASCLAGLGWCAVWVKQKKPSALAFLLILGSFVALLLIFAGRFLDLYFFYAVACLLLFLFWQQALALVRARREKQREEQRASQLEVALAQARQKNAPDKIQLVSAGHVDYVATNTITQFKGAGDYVEVQFENGGTSLYNGGLSQLERDLPPTFLRVHRSHIVNTAFVSALERDASGIGRLVLTNGTEAPVSRRIMPKVRSALAGA